VLAAWADLAALLDTTRLVPIAYMNSAAELKAFVGRQGGLICTSANADKAFDWAAARGDKLLFLPDEHLGRNTANAKGIPRDEILLWNPLLPQGGHTPEAIAKARVLLWAGHCHVHMNFTPAQITARRAAFPGVRVIVHPECREEVVAAADVVGSTQTIVREVQQAKPGAILAIGTELNLIARLIEEHPDKTIMPLTLDQCPLCVNMYRTSLQDLAWTLDALRDGSGNIVHVEEPTKRDAHLALTRMLELGA
jgi:quinolinate synthase